MRNFSRSRKNPWSYKIDYDKAIAEDLKLIADIENCIARGWIVPAKYVGTMFENSVGLLYLFMEDREKARAFGVSDEELEAYAHVADFSDEGMKLFGFDSTRAMPPGWFRLGDALGKRLEGASMFSAGLLTAEKLADALKHAKTSLARHRRNQQKFAPKA